MNLLFLNWKDFLADARHFQILYLGSFLLLGITLLHWGNEWNHFLTIMLAAQIVQFIGGSLTTWKPDAWKSALITSLGLCLLFKTNTLETAIIGTSIAIASKFILRINGKHIFNPVNIGIILGILITQDAWISPGQWGSHLLILFILGILGFLVLTRINRLDASLTFLLVFGGLQYYRSVLYLGWGFDFYLHQMASGTLVLFTFFMLTDPMTTPNHRTARILWVSVLSIIAFYLANFHFINAAPVWVLFFMSPLTPFMDWIWKDQKFEWQKTQSFSLNKI